MPWTNNDAEKHTHKATTPALKELWAKVANESLDRTGDEGRAIREANAVWSPGRGTRDSAFDSVTLCSFSTGSAFDISGSRAVY